MTTDHRQQAERYLASADTTMTAALEKTLPIEDQQHAAVLAGICTNRALTHATLARDEEHAASTADMRDALRLLRQRDYGMRTHVSKHIADALTSNNAGRWKAARDLATALDQADVNLDKDVEGKLFAAGYDAKTAFNGPGAAERADNPWAASPDITADIPAPVRRVIAGHLAEALLDPKAGDVQQWARGLTFELKRVGLDLAEAIKERITAMTLGADPSEPPF